MFSITSYKHLPKPQYLEAVLESLKEHRKILPLFKDLKNGPDFNKIQSIAGKFRAFTDVVILGTGGSSLAGQTLTAISNHSSPRLHFCDNIDPHSFERLKTSLNVEKTGLIIISKSGNTAETLMQSLLLVPLFKGFEDHIHVITQASDSALQALAAHWGLSVTLHPPEIGGRYSAFTVVGLVPAAIAGLNIEEICAGANNYLNQALSSEDTAPIIGAAQAIKAHQNISVLMTYCDRLAFLGLWYRQLWAESLGKHGKGTTPVPAMGAVDQHSQLQLYLDGPDDKIFTVIQVKDEGLGDAAEFVNVMHSALAPLISHRMQDLFTAEAEATIETLNQAGKPIRSVTLDRLNEASLGGLMMHFILETLAAAQILKVNPFDQPAVESGKLLAHEYLLKNQCIRQF